MISRISILGFALLLSACGGKDEPAHANRYPQHYRGHGGMVGSYCSPHTVQTWQRFVAAPCRFVQSEGQSAECLRGVDQFRLANRGAVVNCMISRQDAQWETDDPNQFLPINEDVLQKIERHFGGQGEWRRPNHGGGRWDRHR